MAHIARRRITNVEKNPRVKSQGSAKSYQVHAISAVKLRKCKRPERKPQQTGPFHIHAISSCMGHFTTLKMKAYKTFAAIHQTIQCHNALSRPPMLVPIHQTIQCHIPLSQFLMQVLRAKDASIQTVATVLLNDIQAVGCQYGAYPTARSL